MSTTKKLTDLQLSRVLAQNGGAAARLGWGRLPDGLTWESLGIRVAEHREYKDALHRLLGFMLAMNPEKPADTVVDAVSLATSELMRLRGLAEEKGARVAEIEGALRAAFQPEIAIRDSLPILVRALPELAAITGVDPASEEVFKAAVTQDALRAPAPHPAADADRFRREVVVALAAGTSGYVTLTEEKARGLVAAADAVVDEYLKRHPAGPGA